ncbi:MAG: DNA-processing protein DprA [Oscillospiraceae bacterium]|nr:DNA-processing protein DprA [Oscillospiraceae bacterium]
MSSPALWIWLSTPRGLPAGAVPALLEAFGSPTEIYAAATAELAEALGDPAAAETFASRDLTEADRILGECAAKGLSVVTLQDASYPDRLRSIEDPPAVLYVKGRLPAFDLYPAVAVVGTRKASGYGLYAAKTIAAELADAGVIVVSGMAAGCDAAAHSGALSQGGATVAVLGCGADVCYPRENQKLYRDIPVQGAVVSEYPPGTAPVAKHFPVRNRILSGLCNGVLVAEAAARSGSLITAEYALAQGRDVYAVPGNIDNPASAGCNALIQQGAKLVTCGRDILDELLPLYGRQMSLRPVAGISAENDPYLAGNAFPVFQPAPGEDAAGSGSAEERIRTLLKNGRMALDDIIEASGLGSDEIGAALTLLELDGAVRPLPGGIFELAE